MRIGINPSKELQDFDAQYSHQIILPLYIPELSGYYEKSLEVFKICLNSLKKTVHKNTFITVVNNGSCNEVVDYLNKLYSASDINELIHTTNIGKNKAIIKALSMHNFKIVTISDADVLFVENWQKETMKILYEFPKASVVGLVPQFNIFKSLSFNLIFDNFFSKRLKFTKVKNPKALALFYKSIGWKDDYNQNYLKYILTLTSKNGVDAVVGSGHFVATYRRESIKTSFSGEIKNGLSSKFDRELLDVPSLKLDMWRLTTSKNFAFHMGNQPEEWMYDELKKSIVNNDNKIEYKKSRTYKIKLLSHYLKNHIFRKILQNKYIYRKFMTYKGLPKEVAKDY